MRVSKATFFSFFHVFCLFCLPFTKTSLSLSCNRGKIFCRITLSCLILYQNHFKDNEDATHEVVFVGTPEAMGVAYDSPSDAGWKLFQSELSKYCKDVNSGSGTRLSSFGDESNTNYLVQDVIFQKITDSKLFKEKFDLMCKYSF